MSNDRRRIWWQDGRMAVEKFKLALGIFWSVFTLYFIITLLPPMDRLLREWEAKVKRGGGKIIAPSRLQRVIMILLTSLMSGVVFASAFHRDFGEMTGINSGATLCLMMILPGLYFAVGMLEKRLKKKQGPV